MAQLGIFRSTSETSSARAQKPRRARWMRFTGISGTKARYTPPAPLRVSAIYLLATFGQIDRNSADPAVKDAPYFCAYPQGLPKGMWAGDLERRATKALAACADPSERAAWRRGLYEIGAYSHGAFSQWQASGSSVLEKYITVMAVINAALKTNEMVPDELAPALAELIDQRQTISEMVETRFWPWDEGVEPQLLALCSRLSEAGLELVSPAFVRLLSVEPSLLF